MTGFKPRTRAGIRIDRSANRATPSTQWDIIIGSSDESCFYNIKWVSILWLNIVRVAQSIDTIC